ncbi:MAG: hypothetical protein CL609_16160 [Anaerolineaceae bacterium]|nr:hypothetical protein [Anaerolineaceae bacterium]
MEKITPNYAEGIPLPIVNFNRALLTGGILIALIFQQAWITTLLFLLLLPTTLFGRKYSLIYMVGRVLFKKQIPNAEREDQQLQRFNNTIATTLLGIAQILFAVNLPIGGWIFAVMVMLASGVALAGFCVGCFLYYQFKLNRYRLFGP